MTAPGQPPLLTDLPTENDPPATTLISIGTRGWRPEDPDWLRGTAALILLVAVIVLVLIGKDTGPGFGAVSAAFGLAMGHFFKK